MAVVVAGPAAAAEVAGLAVVAALVDLEEAAAAGAEQVEVGEYDC